MKKLSIGSECLNMKQEAQKHWNKPLLQIITHIYVNELAEGLHELRASELRTVIVLIPNTSYQRHPYCFIRHLHSQNFGKQTLTSAFSDFITFFTFWSDSLTPISVFCYDTLFTDCLWPWTCLNCPSVFAFYIRTGLLIIKKKKITVTNVQIFASSLWHL